MHTTKNKARTVLVSLQQELETAQVASNFGPESETLFELSSSSSLLLLLLDGVFD